MKYISANFIIERNGEMLQTCREILTAMLGDAGFESFEETPAGVTAYAQKQLFDKDTADSIITDFPIDGTTITYSVSDVEDTDWNKTWEESGFEPISVAGKILVYDSRRNTPCHTGDNMAVVGIKTEMAFGTGTHETTQMMIEALTETPVEGMRVLDCGCGTGILAIVASKLGAAEVTAYDIDEWSAKNTIQNAADNAVDNICVLTGDAGVLKNVEGFFDIIMANINRNILLNDLSTFHSKAKKGTKVFLSGFYNDDIDMLEKKAAELGLVRYGCKDNGEWAMLMFTTTE